MDGVSQKVGHYVVWILTFGGDKKMKELKKRPTRKICKECGVSFMGGEGRRICPVCYQKEIDPYGVMLLPKLGNRICKLCGTRLYVGQYDCPYCEGARKPSWYRPVADGGESAYVEPYPLSAKVIRALSLQMGKSVTLY